MLTAWLISQQERLAPSPWSPETQRLLRKYGSPSPERERQFDELTLVAVHGVFIFLATAFVALLGFLTSPGARATAIFATTYAGVAGGLCTGLFLHLGRYYDALICRLRAERRSRSRVDGADAKPTQALRWPRASSDTDFVVAMAASACIVLLSR
jgi:hypothetical protein